MVDHTQNDSIDISNEPLLRALQNAGNRHGVRATLRGDYDLDEDSLACLYHLARFSKGAAWTTLAGEPATLLESMNGWWAGFEHEREFLEACGCIEKEIDHFAREYWRLTKFSWELLAERHRFDLGESGEHERAAALLRTYYHVVEGFGPAEVEMYPELAVSQKEADLLVHPHSQERRRELEMPPGKKPIHVEVVTDHHNSERVVEKYQALTQERGHDSLWLFSSREVANKWLRAIERAPETDVGTGYKWSKTTPIETLNDRVQDDENGIAGIDGIVTFHQLEGWFPEERALEELVRDATPVHLQVPGGGEH